MADIDGIQDKHDYHLDQPQTNQHFDLKGCHNLDWGMKNRLSNIFRPDTGRTVMLAVDHGYFMGPTTGLERIDVNIVPLLPYSDTLMCTRGVLKSLVPAGYNNGIVMRASGGPSILKDDISYEDIACDMEDGIRMNVSAMAVQVFIGSAGERESIHNMTRLVDAGNRYGIPVLGVTAVGKQLTRDAKYMRLATRMCAELGATYVKTYYVEKDFDTVTASCPVPIVIAGGKKQPEPDALAMAYNAIQQGASGVDMGRNIFQSEDPAAMIQAVSKVVHEDMKPGEAHELFLHLKNGGK